MPYVRFSRDKRGYENTYVLHASRADGKKARLLYWFRTPPNVRVGRLPLDEEAIRAVEAHNPDVPFDWGRMLKVRPAPPPPARGASRSGPGAKRTRRGQTRGGDPGRSGGPPSPPEPRRTRSRSPRGGVAEAESRVPVTAAPPPETEPGGPRDAEIEAAAEVVQPDIPVVAELLDPDAAAGGFERADVTGDDPGDAGGLHPVVSLMGDEMLARLRTRYAEIQARITEKALPPETTDALRARAEQLNPDRWRSVEESVTGIERFESEVEAIRAELGRKPPRRRPAE